MRTALTDEVPMSMPRWLVTSASFPYVFSALPRSDRDPVGIEQIDPPGGEADLQSASPNDSRPSARQDRNLGRVGRGGIDLAVAAEIFGEIGGQIENGVLSTDREIVGPQPHRDGGTRQHPPLRRAFHRQRSPHQSRMG